MDTEVLQVRGLKNSDRMRVSKKTQVLSTLTNAMATKGHHPIIPLMMKDSTVTQKTPTREAMNLTAGTRDCRQSKLTPSPMTLSDRNSEVCSS